jgi:hypothetical protein
MDGGAGLQVWRIVVKMFNKQSTGSQLGVVLQFWAGNEASNPWHKKLTCHKLSPMALDVNKFFVFKLINFS